VLLFTGIDAPLAAAQSFQGTTAVQVNGGVTLPVGSIADFWGAGPAGRLCLRFPATPGVSLGLEGGFTLPSSNLPEEDTFQVPIRLLFFIPLAGEAASTPYFAFGPGATVNIFSFDYPTGYFSDGSPAQSTTKTKTYFAYTVKVGYLLRPESMTNTFFDLGMRYEQQMVGDGDDWRNVDLEVGVGLGF
jgi:hypothetical protein